MFSGGSTRIKSETEGKGVCVYEFFSQDGEVRTFPPLLPSLDGFTDLFKEKYPRNDRYLKHDVISLRVIRDITTTSAG